MSGCPDLLRFSSPDTCFASAAHMLCDGLFPARIDGVPCYAAHHTKWSTDFVAVPPLSLAGSNFVPSKSRFHFVRFWKDARTFSFFHTRIIAECSDSKGKLPLRKYGAVKDSYVKR